MWPSYVINLAANAGRLANCARQLDGQGIPWQRVDAVNGWALTDAEIDRVYSQSRNAARGKHPLVKPEIGCYLSHLNTWKQIAEGDAPGGFIFEDDFEASPKLAATLEQLSAVTSDWDMVKLFSFDPDPKMVWQKPLSTDLTIGEPYRVPTCLIGYGVTREAARRLVAKSLPFFRPVDEDMKYFWEKDIKVGLVMPPPIIVGDQSAETGTIGDARRNDAKARNKTKARRPLHKLLYQIDYLLRLHYHRLRGR